MPSWDEVRSHLRTHLKVTQEESTWLGLVWRFPDAQESVLQEQRVGVIQALGEPHLLVLCEAVAADKLPAGELLAHNMSLAVGAVAQSGDLYVVRHVQPLAEVDLARLGRTLELTAHEAARLRARVAPLAGALQAQPPVSPVFPSD